MAGLITTNPLLARQRPALPFLGGLTQQSIERTASRLVAFGDVHQPVTLIT